MAMALSAGSSFVVRSRSELCASTAASSSARAICRSASGPRLSADRPEFCCSFDLRTLAFGGAPGPAPCSSFSGRFMTCKCASPPSFFNLGSNLRNSVGADLAVRSVHGEGCPSCRTCMQFVPRAQRVFSCWRDSFCAG